MTPTRRPRGLRLSGHGAAGSRRGRSSCLMVPEERMAPSLKSPGEGSSQHTQRPRGRLPPFSEEENQVLVASYFQRHTQIRALGISRVSAPERERLWEQIAVAVSAVGGRARRTADKVQKHLNDLVGRLRRLLDTWARQGYVTRRGVAPSHLSQLREYQRKLLDIISLETVVGAVSRDDTDDIQHAQSPLSSSPGSPSGQQQPQEPPTQTDQAPPATQQEEEAAAPSTFPLQRIQEEDLGKPQLIMAAAGVGDDTLSNVEAFQQNAAASPDLPPQVPTLDAAQSAPLPPGRRQLIELGERLAAQVDRLWEQGRPSTQMDYVERTLQLLQQDLGQQAWNRQQLKEQLQRMDQNQASQLLMLTTAINNQTGVLRQSREEIRALRLAVQQLNATIARRSYSRGSSSEEEGVVLLQDEHVARPGTESQRVADSELPPVDPPSQLVTLPTSLHAPTDPNTQTHHSDPSHHTASPCSHSSNMPPPDQPTSTHIVPTSTPLFSLPSATHTSGHAQTDLSPYSTFTTPLRESPNPQIRSYVPAQNVIPSTLPLFSLPTNLASQSFTHLPSFTFFTSLNPLLPQSTSHTLPTSQAQPLSSNPLQQLAIKLPQQQQMAMLQQQQQEQMALLLQQQQEQMAMLLEPRQEPRQEPQQPH